MRLAPHRVRQLGRVLAVFALSALGASSALAAPTYTITDLGTLSGTTKSIATGINEQGQVVGVAYNTNDPNQGYDIGARSFLYSGGQMTQTSPIGGLANAINDSGQAVGGLYKDINSAGDYVGGRHLISGGQDVTLPLFAFGINDSGLISGSVNAQGGSTAHAAVYSNGQLTDLNWVIGGNMSGADAINNHGHLLIGGDNGAQVHSVLYANGVVTDLASLPGGSGKVGRSLNDSDQIVGDNFLYSAGQFSDLNALIPTSSGWSRLSPSRINNAGQIVGQGLIDGEEHAFLMTPIGQTVPEPSSLAVFGAMAIGLAAIGIRRDRSNTVR